MGERSFLSPLAFLLVLGKGRFGNYLILRWTKVIQVNIGCLKIPAKMSLLGLLADASNMCLLLTAELESIWFQAELKWRFSELYLQ